MTKICHVNYTWNSYYYRGLCGSKDSKEDVSDWWRDVTCKKCIKLMQKILREKK